VAKVKGSAPGQYLGYALQPVRLFYHLLTSPQNSLVGLESVDDVSVHSQDGRVIAEQCKSALKTNPISDWSVELWKTFDIWVENSTNAVLDPATTSFRMYVTPAKSGKVAQQLSDLKTKEEINKLIDGIEVKLHKMAKPPKCSEYLVRLLQADRDIVLTIVKNFSLTSVDADPLFPIYCHLDSTVRPGILEKVISYGLGEAKRQIDSKIRNAEERLISAQVFRKKFRASIATYDSTSFLHSLSDRPGDEVLKGVIAQAPNFVKQLDLVGADLETKTRAASDFLMASFDRTAWANEGLIFEESIDTYNDAMHRRFTSIKAVTEIAESGLDKPTKGYLIYQQCCNGDRISLEGREVAPHFLSGSMNGLADNLEIGWHQDYAELIEGEKD